MRGFLFLDSVIGRYIVAHLLCLSLSGVLTAQEENPTEWALTAQASPFLGYIGSFGADVSTPALNNDITTSPGISVLLRKPRQEFWLGMGLSMHISSDSDRIIVPSMDGEGAIIPNEFVEEEVIEQMTRVSARIWKENHLAESRLKGLFTRHIGFQMERLTFEYDPRNPLEAMIGDTLSMNSGHRFGLDIGFGLGILYMVDEQVFISGAIETSFILQYRPDERYRIVESDNGQANIVQRYNQAGGSSISLGHRVLPSLRMGFIIQ